MYFVLFFDVACKISKFNMWTAKHLAQASWTELTLPWKDLQWSSWSKVILLHFFDTWAQFPSSKLHKYPNIFKIISSGNGKVWKLTIQCNMVWPFFPHFLHIICGHHGVWWSTFHCWQYEQNSSVAISLIKGITTRTQFSEIFSFNIYHLKWLKLWSSGSFSWCRLEYFLLTKPHVCLQERSLKAQNAALEKKQHESWVTVRQETRRMTEANTEMQTLRTR